MIRIVLRAFRFLAISRSLFNNYNSFLKDFLVTNSSHCLQILFVLGDSKPDTPDEKKEETEAEENKDDKKESTFDD